VKDGRAIDFFSSCRSVSFGRQNRSDLHVGLCFVLQFSDSRAQTLDVSVLLIASYSPIDPMFRGRARLPVDSSLGAANMTATNANGNSFTGAAHISSVAPGLFAANANGSGVTAAVVLRIKEDGTQVYEAAAQLDTVQTRFIARPIDLGPETDQVFLILYGTGARLRSSLSNVLLKIGGVDADVLYAGESLGFVGPDQFNARLPRSLIGRGDVDVVMFVHGYVANTVQINIK
jgi:uncharacterized protein (TIGR03437 family)